VRYEVMQFAVATTNQNEVGRAHRSRWSQPRQTGSCAMKGPSSPWLRPTTAHLV